MIRTLAAAIGGGVFSQFGGPDVAAGACTRLGRACARGKGRCCGGGVCAGKTCRCPANQKPCQGRCIARGQCCATCGQGRICCGAAGRCVDVRNDPDFCGRCADNAKCPGGAICANGECGLTCGVLGAPCFAGCACAKRIDPAHLNQQVCAGLGVFTCDSATACATDADCSPATLGFRQVCVSDLCPGQSVCADPCA